MPLGPKGLGVYGCSTGVGAGDANVASVLRCGQLREVVGVTSASAMSPPRAAVQAELDPGLVTAAVAGDRRAVAGVLGTLRPLVQRYCLGRLGTRLDGVANAEDCAQDILLAVVAALPRYSHDPAGFLPFVFGIAAHKVADAHRKRAREACAPVPMPPAGPWQGMDPTLDEVERLDALEWSSGLLDTLPARQREVLVLRIVLGFSAEETAAAVGMSSPGAVRVAQHRALATLRKALRRREGVIV